MATQQIAAAPPVPQIVAHEVTPKKRGWVDWVTTTDHKKIGIMYLVLTFGFFVLGGVEALMIRLQLSQPNNTLLDPQTYNELFTMHGTTMIFLFVVPVMAGFGNYFVPLMIGARDMAFPKINALSFWLLAAGGVVFYASIFFSPPECGWFCYAPLSETEYLPSGGVDAWIYLIHLTGISSLVGAINFYATIANMRAPGMGWGRLPLFVWTILTYSILLILALPVIAAAVTLLLTDRHFGTHFYDPSAGGSPLLWQHLFWFFGHPEVYIMVLPGFGIISEVLPVFSRKPIFGYKAIAAATVVIAFLGLLVWAHHMFATPSPTIVLVFFMMSSFLIAVPTGVKIFNWIATLWRGTIEFTTSLLFAVAFVGTFVIGGISGIFLAVFPVDWQLTDTYYVVAHFHYVLMGGAVLAIFSGLYYWFPKMSGRMLGEGLGKLSFWLMLVGFHVTFFIQHAMGLDGMPRRIYEYGDTGNLHLYNMISTTGSFILAAGVGVTFINVLRSVKNGAIAGPDPWKANTLEWFTTSPPPVNNFDAVPRIRSVEPMKDIRRQVARQAELPTRSEPMVASGAGTGGGGGIAESSNETR
jgi:cytochrome c oxidase subunit 1